MSIHAPPEPITPVTPAEVRKGMPGAVPDFIIAVFNGFLAERARNGHARIKQDDVIREVMKHSDEENFARQDIFDRCWLDIEGIYEAAGWNVEFRQPSIGDSFDAYYEFSATQS